MQPQQPPDSFVVTVVQEPTPETTIQDVVLGAFGIVGTLVLAAVVLGALLSVVLLALNRWRSPESQHLPPVSPLVPPRDARPSSQEQ